MFFRKVNGKPRPRWFILLALFLLLITILVCTINTNQVSKLIKNLGVQATPYRSCTLRTCGSRPIGNNAKTADTWNNIHPFLTFDYNITDPTVETKYDFVWGAEVSHTTKLLNTGNTNTSLSYYFPFHRDYGTFSRNSALQPLSYWQSLHPDWILYKCDRVTPAYEYGHLNMPLDFTNPAVLNWQIQTYALPASQQGYDSLAADNVDFGNWYGACGIYRNGQWVQLFSGQSHDNAWRVSILNWIAQMQQAVHKLPHPLSLICNFAFGGLYPMDPQVLQAVSNMDGVVDEGGFTHFGEYNITGSYWQQLVQLIETVQQQNKPYYIIDQFSTHSISSAQIQWALASYLMGKEHSSSLFITTEQGYGSPVWFNEYNAQIGSPTDSMYQAQNVFWRDYTNGLSLVNASAKSTYTVTLKTGVQYQDLYGNLVGPTVTLPPHSGIVLLLKQ